jgi:dolichol-phosphate mannosyltransferase
MIKFSLILPVFNEEQNIELLFSKLDKLWKEFGSKYEFEFIAVNDGSTDGSKSKIEMFNFVQIVNQKNLGKGRAVKNGSKYATGDYIVVHDADLEYEPFELPLLFEKIISNPGSCVYGSRYLKKNFPYMTILPKKNQNFMNSIFNFCLSIFFFITHRYFITDLLTAYKVYPAAFYKSLDLKTSGFETDHEITLEILKSKMNILEVPISYIPRSKSQGKKINYTDAIKAIKIILFRH